MRPRYGRGFARLQVDGPVHSSSARADHSTSSGAREDVDVLLAGSGGSSSCGRACEYEAALGAGAGAGG